MSYSAFSPPFENYGPSYNIPPWDGAFQRLVSQSSQSSADILPWTNPDRMTISFAPDGTRISAHQSSLFASFRSLMTANQLESQVLKAFQQWSRFSAINVGFKSDSGLQFGVSGPTQGDARVGDIRVGALPMADDVYAVSIKHDTLVSGTWSGDILFNSNKTFTSAEQFYAVALHEAGHVLGLEHSTNVNSIMYPGKLNSVIIGHDIAAIRTLYGSRRLDEYDIGSDTNNTVDDATRIQNPGSLNGTVPLIAYGDIHVKTDVDYYELPNFSDYNGPIKFEAVSSGISLLRLKLSVYNENGDLLETRSASNGIRGSRLSITIPNALEGEDYIARVEAADVSLYATGSYAIKATLEDRLTADPVLTEQVLLGKYWQLEQGDVRGIFVDPENFFFNLELNLNDTFATAEPLENALPFNTAQQSLAFGSLSYLGDLDYYQFSAPGDFQAGNVLTISITAMEQGRFVPSLIVYDVNQNQLETDVIVNGNGELSLQVLQVEADQTFYVRVAADQTGDGYDQGNYHLMARFDRGAQGMDVFGQGVLSSETGESQKSFHTMYVAETQMFHLALTATGNSTRELAQVWVTIYDRNARPVFRVLTVPGQTRTAKSVILRPGSYTIFVTLASSDTSLVSSLNYTIKGIGITDPIGPEIVNPATKPFKKVGPNDPNYAYPGNRLSPDTFIVVNGNEGVTPENRMFEPRFVDPNAWYWYNSWLVDVVPDL